MGQKITALTRLEIYAIVLASFVFLFGIAGSTNATTHLCSQAAGSGWKTADFSCDIRYEDTGGAGLKTCEYRLTSNDDAPGSWQDAGACSGSGPLDLTATITVGVGQDCNDDGATNCELEYKATDNSDNFQIGPIKDFDIDYNPPDTFIVPDGAAWTKEDNIPFTLSCLDSGSGCLATEYKIIDASLACETVPDETYTTGTSGQVSCSAGQVCEQDVCYASSDNATNQELVKESSVFQIDKKDPEIVSFDVNPKKSDGLWVNADNPDASIEWHVREILPNSGLKEVQVWRSDNGGVDWVQIPGSPFAAPSNDWTSSATDSPADGTYLYGIHVKDNADNEITESDAGFSTIEVQVDKTLPSQPGTPTTGSPTNNTKPTWSWGGSSDTGGSGFDSYTFYWDTTSGGETNSFTDITDTSFTHSTGLSEGTWYAKVVAFDNAQNKSADSSNGSVAIDTTPPNTTITDAPPDPSFSDAASFSFTSTESGTFECEQDFGGFFSCTSPRSYTVTEGSHTFKVRATDSAGNTDSSPASYTWDVILNDPPSISSASDSPDPIAANSTLTFQISWSDPDGDSTRIHICKTNSISGQSCSGGSWCDTSSFSSSSPTSCNYTTQASDEGTNNYYAFVCDDSNACSSSSQDTFLVDINDPVISTFEGAEEDLPPNWINNNTNTDVTISWSVLDTGGADLKQIEVWRAFDANGDGILQSGEWESTPIFIKSSGFTTPSTDSDSYTDTALTTSGTYWYGLHVVDNANNLTVENTPIKVQVDKDDPTALIDEPSISWLRSSSQQQSFLKTTDEDLDSGIDTSQCTFEVCSYEPDGTEHCKGTESRACNITDNTQELFVGPGASHCDFQGRGACDIFVDATDNAGNTGGSFSSYNVDWEFPVVGKLYITATEEEQTYPIQVGNDSPVTYKTHVTDNLEINFCNLYIDGVLEQGPVLPSGGCTNDCVVEFEDVSLPAPGGDNTYNNNYAVCFDASSLAAQGEAVDIEIALLVDLSAIPPQGSTSTQLKLKAQVTGTMTGLIDYKFDCEDDGIWELEVNNETQETYTTEKLCQYASTGIYTARVFVERGGGNTQDTVDISIVPNTKPEAINLDDNNDTADYCFVSDPPIILSWEFSDPDPGDTQTAYQVQIGSIDTGKVQSSNTEFAPIGLSYNTTYSWRVKVWDTFDDSSAWANGTPFTTPSHAYPNPDFTFSPAFPAAEEEVQFSDQTAFAPGSGSQSWSWDFGDTATSTLQNPTHVYQENGAYDVVLSAADDVGICSVQKTVNVTLPFPEWQEISPF